MKALVFFIYVFLFGSILFAEILDVSGTSQFIATGKPGFIKIDAVGSGLKGSLKVTDNLVSGDASFPLSTLDSGVKFRDWHMKEDYINVKKYPDAKMIINEVKLAKNPETNGFSQNQVPFTGALTVHGVSHAVNGTIDLSTTGDVTKGEAQFAIKISDYGFGEPKFLGMKVNDDVEVKVSLEAKKAKTE